VKYLQLVWTAMFRRKTRTIFTLLSVLAAFLLFGLLDSVRSAFANAASSVAGVDRLVTVSKNQLHPAAAEESVAAHSGATRGSPGDLRELVWRCLPGPEEFLRQRGGGGQFSRSVSRVAAVGGRAHSVSHHPHRRGGG
jgi:hypothetical protein